MRPEGFLVEGYLGTPLLGGLFRGRGLPDVVRSGTTILVTQINGR